MQGDGGTNRTAAGKPAPEDKKSSGNRGRAGGHSHENGSGTRSHSNRDGEANSSRTAAPASRSDGKAANAASTEARERDRKLAAAQATWTCALCRQVGPGGPLGEGPFLKPLSVKGKTVHVHANCALLAPQVYEEDGKLQKVAVEVSRGNKLVSRAHTRLRSG
jgi:hypothetical protein